MRRDPTAVNGAPEPSSCHNPRLWTSLASWTLSKDSLRESAFADEGVIDIQRDVPTRPEDVEALRRLRRETPSWFSLSPAECDALFPKNALDRRAVMPRDARPFTLP